jgi:hypothetical protein
LLKRTFDDYNVRYIAAADNLDSANGFDVMSIFRDVINEFYVADCSKKQRASKRSSALQGKVLGQPPYGYKITNDKSVWVIDEYAAGIIREIFNKIIAGETSHSIALSLNERSVLSANNYYQTEKGNPPDKLTPWSGKTVLNLIDNPTYIGTYIANRYTTRSYKDHKTFIRPEEEWVVIENHHPAILDIEVYETALRLRNARRRITKRGDKGVLNGLLFCSDCNSKLGISHQIYDYYVCTRYRLKKPWNDIFCTRHSILRSEVEQIALAKIQQTVALAISDKDKFAEQVNRNSGRDVKQAIKTKSAELTKAQKRVAELDKIISRIYEDHIAGAFDMARFKKMLAGYESEQLVLIGAVERLQTEIGELNSKTTNIQSFIELAKRHGEVTELTDVIARTFIERIVVHDAVKENPKNRRSTAKTQEIHVFLSYIGEFGSIE